MTAYDAGKYVINVENTFEQRTYILNVNLKGENIGGHLIGITALFLAPQNSARMPSTIVNYQS